jgi:hypothetical protein
LADSVDGEEGGSVMGRNQTQLGPEISYRACMRMQLLDMNGEPAIDDQGQPILVSNTHATPYKALLLHAIKGHPLEHIIKADWHHLRWRSSCDRWWALNELCRHGIKPPVVELPEEAN